MVREAEMVTLEKERELFYDEELISKLAELKSGTLKNYEESSLALNLRAMPALADKVSREGIKKYPSSVQLYKELILANTLYPERLIEIRSSIKKSPLNTADMSKALILLEYYLDENDWSKNLDGHQKAAKDALYFELSGHKAMEAGDFSKAVKCYEDAGSAAGYDPRPYYYRAEALMAMGKKEQAFKELTNLAKSCRFFVQAWNGLAKSYLEEKKLHLAYQSVGMALSINPNDWGAFLALADYYFDSGEYGRARGILEILLSLNPSKTITAEICNYLGYLFSLDNRYAEAQEALERALRLNPRLAEAWYNLGNIAFHKKSLKEALACYERAATSDPKMAAVYTQIGLTLIEMGNLSSAFKPLEKALELDSSEYLANLGLSELYRRSKDGSRALSEAKKALAVEPSDPNVHNILAIAYEFSRDFEKAERSYRQALEIDPKHRWAANNLGYLYEKLMKFDSRYKKQAMEAWRRRLLICSETGASIRGAVNHLLKLGATSTQIKQWLKRPAS
jgi:tetratricopeptide (TPR) repeat protein